MAVLYRNSNQRPGRSFFRVSSEGYTSNFSRLHSKNFVERMAVARTLRVFILDELLSRF